MFLIFYLLNRAERERERETWISVRFFPVNKWPCITLIPALYIFLLFIQVLNINTCHDQPSLTTCLPTFLRPTWFIKIRIGSIWGRNWWFSSLGRWRFGDRWVPLSLTWPQKVRSSGTASTQFIIIYSEAAHLGIIRYSSGMFVPKMVEICKMRLVGFPIWSPFSFNRLTSPGRIWFLVGKQQEKDASSQRDDAGTGAPRLWNPGYFLSALSWTQHDAFNT